MAKSLKRKVSDRAFEEEVMLGGFSTAPVKGEGTAISFDDAQETYTARYTHETIALAFSITEEAIEDNFMIVLHRVTPRHWLVQWLKPSKSKLLLS